MDGRDGWKSSAIKPVQNFKKYAILLTRKNNHLNLLLLIYGGVGSREVYSHAGGSVREASDLSLADSSAAELNNGSHFE